MKLWILKPVEGLPDSDNPWEPWYDKVFGFVVRAKTEKEARECAHAAGGTETVTNSFYLPQETVCTEKEPWRNKKYSTCIELTKVGESGIIIKDYANA